MLLLLPQLLCWRAGGGLRAQASPPPLGASHLALATAALPAQGRTSAPCDGTGQQDPLDNGSGYRRSLVTVTASRPDNTLGALQGGLGYTCSAPALRRPVSLALQGLAQPYPCVLWPYLRTGRTHPCAAPQITHDAANADCQLLASSSRNQASSRPAACLHTAPGRRHVAYLTILHPGGVPILRQACT